MKTLADAVMIRNKICRRSNWQKPKKTPGRHRDLLTFVLVAQVPPAWRWLEPSPFWCAAHSNRSSGGSDPTSARIVLVDMASRVLGSFLGGPFRGGEEAAGIAGCGSAARTGRRSDRCRRHRGGGRAHTEQNRDLDRRRGAFACRQVVECRDGPCGRVRVGKTSL